MKRVIFLLAIFASVLGIGIYMTCASGASKKHVIDPNKVKADMVKAKELLDSGEYNEALEIIAYHIQHTTPEDLDPEWIKKAIHAYGAVEDPFNLFVLYQRYPDQVRSDEKASLLVARIAAFTKDTATYNTIKQSWRGKEKMPTRWKWIEIDRLILQGEIAKAQALIEEKSYTGVDEAERLIRSARLALRTDMDAAWNILEEAQKIEPEHPELYLWRGRVAEQRQRLPVAQSEYLTALRLAPNHPVFRDQLGEFYRRYRQYKQALQIWSQGLLPPSADVLWLKTLFWSRVSYPVEVKWKEIDPPGGINADFVLFLQELPKGRFWDQTHFAKLAEKETFLERRQETFWLQLLESLKTGEEEQAWKLLQDNRFSARSWDPDLELQLRRLMSYRRNGHLDDESVVTEKSKEKNALLKKQIKHDPTRHQLFKHLDRLAGGTEEIPDHIEYLLKSEEGFAAFFLAGGWLEAALELRKEKVYSDKYPDWLPFGMAQSLRQNRGEAEALQFSLLQPSSESLNLIIGELQGITGDLGGALKTFQGLLQADSREIGLRAAWLTGMILLEEKRYSEARHMIQDYKELREHLTGKEMLARIAMLEGEEALADALYGALEEDSEEAKSYLAHRAYQMKQWNRAKELTEKLLERRPSHPTLKENLARIEKELQADSN